MVFGLVFRREKDKKAQFEDEKHALELEFLREKHEQKLEFERQRRALEISTNAKKAELDQSILDYKIKEQQARIDEDFNDFDSDEDGADTPEQKLLFPILAQILNKNNLSPHPVGESENIPPKINEQSPTALSFSDEEINAIYESLPAVYRKVAKSLPDEEIKKIIVGKYPAITQECLTRACARIKR